jgi:hypothetical protein
VDGARTVKLVKVIADWGLTIRIYFYSSSQIKRWMITLISECQMKLPCFMLSSNKFKYATTYMKQLIIYYQSVWTNSITLLTYGKFTLFPPCQMKNSVFITLSGLSRVRCGGLCDSNLFGSCGRFIWDQDSRTCMLHSSTCRKSLTNFMT